MNLPRQYHRQPYNKVIKEKKDPKKLFLNLEYLNKNLHEFKSLDVNTKRSIFGELLYPKIKTNVKDLDRTARITGMLIDFEVFEVEDILDLVNNTSALDERISEAE